MKIKTESFGERFFSFEGRLGRERIAISTLWLCIFGIIIPTPIIILATLLKSEILVIMTTFVFGIPLLISTLSLTTRRCHDLGYSGWIYLAFIVIVALASLAFYIISPLTVCYIIGFPAAILSLYLWAWPGQFEENKYGAPPRGVERRFRDQKEKMEKEFFSFKGRVGRKWFIFLVIFLFSQISTTYSIIEYGMIFLALPDTHRAVVGESMLSLLALMLLYLPLLLIFLRSYSSVIVRRVQDLGWSTAIATVTIGLRILSLSIPIFVIMNASTRELIGYLTGKSSFFEFALLMVIMPIEAILLLILAVKKGESGSNKFGENPVFYSDIFPVEPIPAKDPAEEMER